MENKATDGKEKTQIKKYNESEYPKLTLKELVYGAPMGAFLKSSNQGEQDFYREAGYAFQIIQGNDTLMKCDRTSIVNSIVNVSRTGLTLNPELRLAYLIPYKGKCYFRSSYMGKKEILIRAGVVKDVWVNLVYAKDKFQVQEGTDRKILHEPNYFLERGTLVGGYWVAILQNGEKPFGVMTKDRIDEIRKRSEAVRAGKSSPWDTDLEDMSKKTILNNAFKYLPKTNISDSVMRVLDAESEYERQEFDEWKRKMEQKHAHRFEDDGRVTDAKIIEPAAITNGDRVSYPVPPPPSPAQPPYIPGEDELPPDAPPVLPKTNADMPMGEKTPKSLPSKKPVTKPRDPQPGLKQE